MKFYFNILWIILLQILYACNSEKPKSEIITIDLVKELGESFSSIYMSEIFSDISYIRLQTNDDMMIGNNPDISIVDNVVIVKDRDNCFLFDKNEGKFIRKIGAKGRGPNEFRTASGFVNPINKNIYLRGWQGELLEYDFDGRFHRKISIPDYSDSFTNPSLTFNYTFFDNDIIAYFINPVGTEDKLLMVFTVESEIVSIHNNINIFPDKSFSIQTGESQFYHYNNQLFYKEIYNDTVYSVTNKHLFPHLVLHIGDYLLPYESKWWGFQKDLSEFIINSNLIETTSNFIFRFNFDNHSFLGWYDKTTKGLKISDWDSGIVNDEQDFAPFIPIKAINNNEIMGYTDAWKIKQWFKDNPEKAAQLPPHLKEFEKLTKNDNPVVMIARLKE